MSEPAPPADRPPLAVPQPRRLPVVRLCLLGYGAVARELCALLARQQEMLARRHRLRLLISGVGTRHGSLLAPGGLTAGELPARLGGGEPGALPEPPRPAAELLAAAGADILVELTVMEDGAAPVSTSHILRAFALGMDVVTANKGPIAWHWRQVARAARGAGRRILFESAVMDGLPVFSLLERTLPDCTLLGFEAVLNATAGAVIDGIAAGLSPEEALAAARKRGIAEANPAHDLDGWDAACKAAALANVVMGARMTPADVERESLSDVPRERILAARSAGRRLRMLTTVWREAPHGIAPSGAPVCARVHAAELPPDHPLASLGGHALGIVLHTDLMGAIVVAETAGLVPQAAYGVYADLLRLCEREPRR